jgi:hypothetical protein
MPNDNMTTNEVTELNEGNVPAETPEAEQPGEIEIKREYFPADKMPQLAERLGAIAALEVDGKPLPIVDNMQRDENGGMILRENYGVLVSAIKSRTPQADGTNKNVVIAVTAMQVPDMAYLASFESKPGEGDGAAFVEECVLTAYQTKISNSVRPKPGETTINTDNLPVTPLDFIENRKSIEDNKAFNEIGKEMVAAFKQKGLKNLNLTILRDVLKNAAYASTMYSNVSGDIWDGVLARMIQEAGTKGFDTTVLERWAEERHTRTDDSAIEELTLDNLFS